MAASEQIHLRAPPRFDLLRARVRRYSSADPEAVAATVAMAQITGELTYAFEQHYARNGLSRGRFFLLMKLLDAPGPLSPAELAEHIGCTRATMTGLLDTLEKEGFVRREENPGDRRSYQVVLTDTGRTHLEAMLPDHYRRLAAVTEMLDPQEREQLLGLLQKMRAGIETVRQP